MRYHGSRRITVTCVGMVFLALWSHAAWAEPAPESGPASAPATGPATQPAASQPATQPDLKPIPISFNKAPLQQVAEFLTKQLGKPVLISPDVEKIQVTLVNPKPLPPVEALYVLRTALHEQGVAIEERTRTIHLIPIAQAVARQIRLVGPDEDLAAIQPANEIVRKVFNIRHYHATKLADVLKPLLPNYGHMIADPTTGKLIIVATVEDLLVMTRVIDQIDKPDVSGRELRVFHVQHVDVYELVPMLEKLIASYLGVDVKAIAVTEPPRPARPSGPSGPGSPGAPPSGPERPGGSGGPGGPTEARGGPEKAAGPGVVTITAEARPVLLLPDPRRSAIVVEAPAHVLAQVAQWLIELDQPKPASTDMEIVEVRYGDAEDLAAQLTALLNNIPDESLRSTVRVFAFAASRRLMIRGSQQNRAMLKTWLAEIDADTGVRVTQTYTLKYADAQEVAENIKELFQEQGPTWLRYMYYGPGRGESDRTKVTVTANTRNNSITVVASPEKMKRIEEQIEVWDKRLTGEEAQPRVYVLKYADPEKVRELLENIFTKKERAFSFYDYYMGRDTGQPSPVGRLFGQFRFEAYPDLGKLVVVSKNEENYAVVDKLIAQIDVPQMAGMPRIIQLKYADAEPLAEQLNALLNAPGTPTRILRRQQPATFRPQEAASPYAQTTGAQGQPQRPQDAQQASDQNMMVFWWQFVRQDLKEKQPSNLVGKLRIVPNVEQNLLLITAPEDYADAIETLVRDLDKPGNQVLIKAVIAEVTHEDATSLGYRFSSDPTLFQSGDPFISENALRGLLTYKFEDMLGRQNTVTFNLDVHNLISLLRRVTDIKIRSEPAIFVADNTEGEFFDGQDVPFISNSQTTDVGGLTQSFEYKPVGITLRVRPHITKEGRVALTVNITASSIVPGRTLFGGAIVDRRETNQRVVLEDGKTFMISGMLREEDRAIIRRVPGLGDVPLLGELFKHREVAKVNTELLIFLTPYVIGPESPRDRIEDEPLERLRRRNMLPEEGLGRAAPAPDTQKATAHAAASIGTP